MQIELCLGVDWQSENGVYLSGRLHDGICIVELLCDCCKGECHRDSQSYSVLGTLSGGLLCLECCLVCWGCHGIWHLNEFSLEAKKMWWIDDGMGVLVDFVVRV